MFKTFSRFTSEVNELYKNHSQGTIVTLVSTFGVFAIGLWKLDEYRFDVTLGFLSFLVLFAAFSAWNTASKKALELQHQLTPQIDINFHPSLSIIGSDQHNDKWFRAIVTSKCAVGVKKCTGWLTKIETAETVFEHEIWRLPFSPGYESDAGQKDIPGSVEKPLDVLLITQNDNRIFIPLVGSSCAPVNKNGHYIFQNPGTYLITVKVSSADAVTVQRKFAFGWTGDHRTATWAEV